MSTTSGSGRSMVDWRSNWSDILAGGSPRWKVNDVEVKRQALSWITKHVFQNSQLGESPSQLNTSLLNILCPLAGDDAFVSEAWKQGHSVTTIDWVPEAVTAMRQQFLSSSDPDTKVDEKDWTVEEKPNGNKVWKYSTTSGQITLYEGDMLEQRPELVATFDAVYDKDSFGAIPKSMREPFCQRLADYTKDDAIIYIEVKYKDSDRDIGPPFHVEESDLMQSTNFGGTFDYVASLGKVYDISVPGMKQMGHVLKRKSRASDGASSLSESFVAN